MVAICRDSVSGIPLCEWLVPDCTLDLPGPLPFLPSLSVPGHMLVLLPYFYRFLTFRAEGLRLWWLSRGVRSALWTPHHLDLPC